MSLFLYPYILIIALAVFILLGGAWALGAARKSSIIKQMFSAKVYKEIGGAVSPALRRFKDITFLLGLFFIFVALARPQWGVERMAADTQTSYAVIAVDVSSSMKATDIKPNRIENAKTMLKILVDSMPEVRTGIVAFTSQAYTQCPVTGDTDALEYFINALRADMLIPKGTVLSTAVNRSVEMLARYPGRKALIILTDGEDHEEDALKTAAQFAKNNNVKIITIGIGSPEGELIPDRVENGRVLDYKKDKTGSPVVSKLNERPLLELAAQTDGAYIKYQNFQAVAEAVKDAALDLDRETRTLTTRPSYKDRYQIPLGLAVILVLISLFTPLKKVKFRR